MKSVKVASAPEPIDTTGSGIGKPPAYTAQTVASQFFVDFTQSTSLHGIKHAFGGRNKLRRYIWLAGVLGMAACLIYTVTLLAKSYFKYPTRTTVVISSLDEVEFPRVTICSMSPLNASLLGYNNNSYLVNLMASMTPINFLATPFNLSSPEYAWAWERHTLQYYKSVSNSLNALLPFCTFQGHLMPCYELFEERMTELGMCFTTRNVTSKGIDTKVTRLTGSQRGLQVYFDARQQDYVHNFQISAGFKCRKTSTISTHVSSSRLKAAKGLGVFIAMFAAELLIRVNYVGNKTASPPEALKFYKKIVLHDFDEEPAMIDNGFVISAGSSSYASIKHTKYHYQPSPYKAFGNKECLNTKAADFVNPLETVDHYDKTVCLQECLAKFLLEKCDCIEYTNRGNYSICSLAENYLCSLLKTGDFNMMKEDICQCESPCESKEFDVQLSSALYPSDLVFDYFKTQTNLHETSRTDYAELRIFYTNLIETEVNQVPVHSIDTIVATLGGQMGIFLGASVLTLSEFIEYIILKIWSLFLRSEKKM